MATMIRDLGEQKQREIRQAIGLGLSTKQAAAQAQVSVDTVRRIRQGGRSPIRAFPELRPAPGATHWIPGQGCVVVREDNGWLTWASRSIGGSVTKHRAPQLPLGTLTLSEVCWAAVLQALGAPQLGPNLVALRRSRVSELLPEEVAQQHADVAAYRWSRPPENRQAGLRLFYSLEAQLMGLLSGAPPAVQQEGVRRINAIYRGEITPLEHAQEAHP